MEARRTSPRARVVHAGEAPVYRSHHGAETSCPISLKRRSYRHNILVASRVRWDNFPRVLLGSRPYVAWSGVRCERSTSAHQPDFRRDGHDGDALEQ